MYFFQEKVLARSFGFFFTKIVLSLFLLTVVNTGWVQAALNTNQSSHVYDKQGKDTGVLYEKSYALVIGVSDYTHGWPDLPGVEQDILAVSDSLKKVGFNVTLVKDPDDEAMKKSISQFINQYGYRINNRLLIYFAGHGHTIERSWGENTGYILPKNTPNPNEDQDGFFATAMDMQQIEVYAKRIESKHVLFLFDSCFSGSLFSLSRAIPEDISYKTSKPVRQFITSGSANEMVPDESIFRKQLVEALNGEADTNKDSYVTGVELGEFLQSSVVNYSKGSQHPQYGKIRHPQLDKGDFVFILPKETLPEPDNQPVKPLPSINQIKQPPPPPAIFQHGNLQVNVNVNDAVIFINDQKVGAANIKQPLNKSGLTPGDITIKVEANGYHSQTQKSLIETGQWTQLVFTLQKKVAPVVPTIYPKKEPVKTITAEPVLPQVAKVTDKTILHTLTLRSNVNNDQVYIDDKLMGATRLDELLAPGSYQIRIEKEGYIPYETKVKLTSDKTIVARLNREGVIQGSSSKGSSPTAYIKYILNGGFGRKVFRNSGQLTTSVFKKHLKAHFPKVQSGKKKESVSEAFNNARRIGAKWLVMVDIKHWEDRNSTWSGRKDRVKISVKILKTSNKTVLKKIVIEEEQGKFWGSNTSPDKMLEAPVKDLIDSLF